jgi:hypothetical protein
MENEVNIEPFERAERLPSSLPWAVYRAWDKTSGHRARLSVLWAGEHMPAERVRGGLDWFAEAGYQAQRLTSPAVPSVLSYRGDEKFAYVATDFPAGMTLRDRIAEQGPLPVARAMQISSIIAGVLAQAHAAGWAHGWLNPDTVWVSEGDVVSVNDLGLGLAAQPMIPGAAPFPAAGGFISTDPMRRDMQCLGLLLTLMLTGQLPDPVGVPRGDVFPDDVPGGVVRRIRALINPQTTSVPSAAEWATFAHVGSSGVYSEPAETAGGKDRPDAGYYETTLPDAGEGQHSGLGRILATAAIVVLVALVTWYIYGGSVTGAPNRTASPNAPTATAPGVPGDMTANGAPPADTLTKVQVGPIPPADIDAISKKLSAMGFEPYVKRESGEVYIQVGAFANADGAKEAEAALKSAGLPVRVQE